MPFTNGILLVPGVIGSDDLDGRFLAGRQEWPPIDEAHASQAATVAIVRVFPALLPQIAQALRAGILGASLRPVHSR